MALPIDDCPLCDSPVTRLEPWIEPFAIARPCAHAVRPHETPERIELTR